MVAYSYQPEFIDPTLSCRKRHTIRAERKGRSRHAWPGEALQHYVGMRTKHCRLFARSVCLAALPITIDFNGTVGHPAGLIAGKLPLITPRALDRFARSDGFDNWHALRAFWHKRHHGVTTFRGIIVYWRDMVPG